MRVSYRGKCARRGQETVYQQGPVKFCCAAMCRWWGRLVGFGARDYTASTSRQVNLYLDRPQVGGAALELVPVDFCPWCGEAVEVCRKK